MCPRAGGEADKFGNRYEGAWTIRHLLYVLLGTAQSVTVEDVDDLGEGAEFTLRYARKVEVHQLKRQNGNANSWTIKELHNKNIWANARKHVEAGRHFHFISMLPARRLQELADRAQRSDDFESFIKSWLTKELAEPFDELSSPAIFGSPEVTWRILQGFWIEWPDERDVVQMNSVLAELLLEGASGTLAAVGLGDLVYDNLAVRLDASVIESKFGRYGLRRKQILQAGTVIQQVDSVTSGWAASVEWELLQPVIARSESTQIVELVRGPDKLLLLMGAAGGGKSAVLHQVFQALVADETPVLGFRLDRLDPFVSTAELGKRIGLDISPVTALAAIASERRCVLIVDQVDAVSLVSGRMPRNFDTVANLVREAAAFPNMTVILACRKFDVENDYRIRELVNTQDCARVEVGELSGPQVAAAVQAMGLDAATLKPRQEKLLKAPLHLVLLRSVADEPDALSFETTTHLFDAFWRRKLTDCIQRRSSVRFDAVVTKLAGAISTRQRLSVPASTLDYDNLSVDADVLVSEHVLVRDGRQVAFFHESFFDYAFARGWVEGDGSLVDFLTSGEQELFRRAQVRQILHHLREAEPERFVSEIEALLTSPDIRYHIKDVILSLLGALAEPTTDEWDMVYRVLETEPSFQERLWHSIRSVEWFDRLDAEGVIEDWLDGDLEARRTRALEAMASGAKHRPDRIAEMLRRRSVHPDYPTWLRWLVHFADIEQSRPLFELLLDGVRSGYYEGHEGNLWLSTYGLGNHQPTWAVELLTVHLVHRPDALALNDEGKVPALLDRDNTAIEMVQLGAVGAPELFCEHIIPFMLDVMAATSYELERGYPVADRHFTYRTPNTEIFELEEALLEGAASALRHLVEHDPREARQVLETLAADPHDGAQWLLYEGLRAGGKIFAPWAAELMLQGKHRFMSGYTENSVWTARQVLQATSPSFTDEAFSRIEASILDLRFPWEKQRPGWYVFNLLSGMDEGRLSDLGRRRLGELRRLFERDQPPEPEGTRGGFFGPPIPREATEYMNDDNWLKAIRKHSTDKTNWDTFTGGAREESYVLKDQVIKDAARFSRLALQFTDDMHPAYSDAILLGLGDAEALADPTPAFEAVRHIASLRQPANDRWIGWALRKYLKVVPLDLVELVVDRAVNASDPVADRLIVPRSSSERTEGEDLYLSGMNSARGSASEILGDLLIYDADGSRTTLVLPVLNRLATDASIAVRSCVAHLIHTCMRHAQPQALDAFRLLIDADDRLLAAKTVINLIAYVGHEAPDLARPVVERMLNSSTSATRRAGGRLAALGAMQWEMTDLLELVLTGDDVSQRRGAAGTCARRLPNTSDTVIAQRALRQFINDSNEEVRKTAATVAPALRGESLRPFRGFLAALISSPAFTATLPQLLITVEQAPDRVDDLAMACAQRFVEIYGSESGDIRTIAAGNARHIGGLVVRAYAQATSRQRRSEALDLLDQLLATGAYGVVDLIEESAR